MRAERPQDHPQLSSDPNCVLMKACCCRDMPHVGLAPYFPYFSVKSESPDQVVACVVCARTICSKLLLLPYTIIVRVYKQGAQLRILRDRPSGSAVLRCPERESLATSRHRTRRIKYRSTVLMTKLLGVSVPHDASRSVKLYPS